MYVYIERGDAKIARVEIPDGGTDDDRDVWDCLEEYWPRSYDRIETHMIVPGEVSRWDEEFDLVDGPDSEDGALVEWLEG